MSSNLGGPGSDAFFGFGTNLPTVIREIEAGLNELDAALRTAGGRLGSQGLLGAGMERDIAQVRALAAEWEALQARISKASNYRGVVKQRFQTTGGPEQLDSDIKDFIRKVAPLGDEASKRITTLTDEKGRKLATPALNQLAQVNRALDADNKERARLNRAAETEARRAQAEAKKAETERTRTTERELLDREHARGARALGQGYYQLANGGFARSTQGGQGLRTNLRDFELAQAQERVELSALNARRNAARIASSKDLGGAFLGGLTSGGFGGEGTSGAAGLLRSAGTVLKYTALYSALGAASGSLASIISEAKDYRDSLTDLKVALGGAVEGQSQYVDGLSKISKLAGGNVGEAIDSAARGIRAFTKPGDSREHKQEVGLEFAATAGRLAIISGKPISDVRGDAVAIATSFHLAADDFQRINDVAAGSKFFGGDPTQISQGLANAGQALQAVGFSLEESGAVISQVTSKLDQSGQTTATRLARITSIISGGAGRSLLASLPGVGVEGTARDQLFRLAQQYPNLNQGQQAQVRNTLGQANVRELTVLLESLGPGGNLQKGFEDGFNFAGKGLSEAQRKTTDLVGTLKQITGLTKNIKNNIFDSGALAPFGLLLKVLKPTLEALDDILNIFNRLPGPLRSAGFFVAEMAAAFNILGRLKVRAAQAALENASATQIENGEIGRQNALLAENALLQQRAAGASFGQIGRSAAGGFFAGTGGKVMKGLTAAVVADLVLRGFEGVGSRGQTADTASRRAAEAVQNAATPTELHDAAQRLRGAGKLEDKASSGFLGNIRDALAGADNAIFSKLHLGKGALKPVLGDSGYGDKPGHEEQSRIDKEAARILEARDHRLRDQLKQGTTSVFGDVTNIDNLNDGLATLTGLGRSAASQIDLLNQALGGAITQGLGGQGTILPGTSSVVGGKIASKFFETVTTSLVDAGLQDNTDKAKSHVNKKFDVKKQAQLSVDVADIVEQFIAAKGAADGGVLSPSDLNELAMKLAKKYVDPDATQKEQERLQASLRDNLVTLLVGVTDPSQLIIDPTNSAAIQDLFVGLSQSDANETKIRTNGDRVAAAYTAVATLDKGRAAVLKNGQAVTERAEIAYMEAQQELANSLRERQAAANLAIHGTSAVGGAKASMENARAEVEAATYGSTQFWNALANYNKTIDSFADAQTEAKIATRNSHLDYSNKVAVADAAVKDAKDRLNSLLKRRYASAADFDAKGNPATPTKNVPTEGKAVGDQFVTGFRTVDWFGTGQSIGAQLAAGVTAGAGVPPTPAPLTPLTSAQIDGRDVTDESPQRSAARGKKPAPAATDPNAGVKVDTTRPQVDPTAVANARAAVAQAQQAASEARKAEADKRLALQTAKIQASVFSGSAVSSALAQVKIATLAMKTYAKGTVEWYNALGQYNQAKQSLTTALLEAQHQSRLLNVDLTNPLAVAREDVRAAAAKLAADRKAGAPSDVINADRNALRQAQNTAEATAFQQRLQQAQTNDRLGRISHTAYLAYLQHEHERLQKIAHRTYEQQQELDQVDTLIQEANKQMQGQFNIGDIKLPTPYEVRRSIGASAAGHSYQSTTTYVTTSVEINGADLLQVKQLITKLLGPTATQSATTTTRKV